MNTSIITRENLRGQSLARRVTQLENMLKDPRISGNRERQVSVRLMMESLETGVIPQAPIAPGIDVAREIRKIAGSKKGAVAEFIGSDAFAAAWYERQRYEVDAGREDEPLLYPALYAVTTDASLPKNISIYTLGDAGVVFELVKEGGEVKFANINTGTKTVTLLHYAVALQYTQELFEFNELFRLGTLERQFGVAYNALLNHIHMTPILTYSYTAANQTDGTSITDKFKVTASMPEKYLRTIEEAIISSSTDTDNPRRGPYALVVSTADQFTVERALARVAQQGFDLQSSALGRVQTVIAYDGWTGRRGNDVTTYSGVTSGKAYLVNLAHRQMDFQSYFKYPLRRQMGESDMSRFIMEENIWDTWFGVFADPASAVEEITWPLAADGDS
jgi:hypothetical protein